MPRVHHDVERGLYMLWTIFVIILVLWLLGFSLHIGGGLIHLLLVIAVVVLIFNLVTGRGGVCKAEQLEEQSMASQENASLSGPLARLKVRAQMLEKKLARRCGGIKRFASEPDRGDRKLFAATVWNRDLHNRLMQRNR